MGPTFCPNKANGPAAQATLKHLSNKLSWFIAITSARKVNERSALIAALSYTVATRDIKTMKSQLHA